MKPIILSFDYDSHKALYIQLYEHIKKEILQGAAEAGDKLPSLRTLSKDLGVSLTTTELAYSQLLVEGYIVSRPQSGYYISQISYGKEASPSDKSPMLYDIHDFTPATSPYVYDLSCFDFLKWKKCASKVFNEYSHLLLFESDPQGEAALRFEIAKYIFHSRGVNAAPDQIVVGAGTQQITGHLCRILTKMGISHVSLESPGYLPVQSMFVDGGFTLSHIPVGPDGIQIQRLPINISSAVYVSPSNQFPTGAIMPIGRRYELLDWANANQSIIIEDDYDSGLRCFGRPVPALKGLDESLRVVYLGSFSSALFPAIKISYMVLPWKLQEIFGQIKDQYTQTCSKAEQLTLAFYMEDGYYYTGIKKLRNLYSQKLQAALQALNRYGTDFIMPIDTQSGINLTLKVRSVKSAEALAAEAETLGLEMLPLSQVTDQSTSELIFYYNQVPLGQMEPLLSELIALWRKTS